jgi:thiosulfate dehydrogenase
MKNGLALTVGATTLALYVGVIAIGMRLGPRALDYGWHTGPKVEPWRAARLSGLSEDRLKEVELGRRLFDETPLYSSAGVKSRISCSNCHLEGGIAPYGLAVVGSAQAFPQFSKRAGRQITLEDRVEECMTRSENGDALPVDGQEMKAIVTYIEWLSEPHPQQATFVGRGLEVLPKLTGDPVRGADVYATQCAGCHGKTGEGKRPMFPPLWGLSAFNDGAGMNGVEKMAAFVHYNMPHNRKGILTPQDAYDVAAFVHAQPRPAFNHQYDRF